MRILNFGSLNIDNVYTVEHFLRPGETMSSGRLEIFCGGKGLNQSIAMARAGACVYHAGCVGAHDGEALVETLKQAGADVSMLRRTEGVTGHAIIQVDRSGQNCILLFGGANQEITAEQVDETLSHFGEGDILVLQNEISCLSYIMEQAGKRGMRIYLNPSPVTEELLKLPLHLVNCFILNEIEAADLCGKSAPEDMLLTLLKEQYNQADILLTLGEKGSIYYNGDSTLRQPAFPVEAVDTTAAGDTFTGYYIAGIAAGHPVGKALLTASRAASVAVSRKGASVSIPERREVEALLEV